MIFPISNVLDPDLLASILRKLQTVEFVDGKATAGWYVQDSKHNQQAESSTLETRDLREQVKQALSTNSLFQSVVRPKVIHSLLFSRYDAGMFYARHIDNALMTDQQWRSDVSFTIFLNAPNEYEGGELIIEGAADEKSYKGSAKK